MLSHPKTLAAAVLGWPINHSLSPRLHGFWLRRYGIAGTYDAIAVAPADLAAALRGLREQGLRGVNLTVPHKQAACAIIDNLDNAARRVGAVNLVVADGDGRLQGRNTDIYGFAQNLLTSGFTPGGAALVLGAGGAARAVVAALADMGMRDIVIANRTRDSADRLAAQCASATCNITAIDWRHAPEALRDASLLVNATSLGMAGQPPLDLALDLLPLSATVTDIVYAPLQTDLLRRAARRGHPTIDGLGMLLHQARPCFAAFFGRDPEVTPALRAYVLEASS